MATASQLSENSRQGFDLQKAACIGREAWLSGNMHWGCGHAYDETAVEIAVYVRNDPVNLVDPDGRKISCVNEWNCIVTVTAPAPPDLVISGTTTSMPWQVVANNIINSTWARDDLHPKSLLSRPDEMIPPGLSNAERILNQDFVRAWKHAVDLILSNPNCAHLMGGYAGLMALESTKFVYAPVKSNPLYYSADILAATDLNNGTITINSNSYFFSQVDSNGNSRTEWSGLSGTNFRTMVILHELGHIVGSLEHDSYSVDANRRNTEAVLSECFKRRLP
jgi:hypothetical protein